MARIAYFQPFSGASGDMALGALVDAGLPLAELESGLQALGLPGWRLDAVKEMRGPFSATRLRVLLDRPSQPPCPGNSSPQGEQHHTHDHHAPAHGEEHHHHHHHHHHGHEAHPDAHADADDSADEPHRHLQDIIRLLEGSSLPEGVKTRAIKVFRRLGQAEAKVHGMPLEEVYFHEVGAVDSIIDIVGTCLGLHLLGVEEVHCAPVVVGTGYVRGAHGVIPLPAPATLELLRGFPLEQRDTGAELTTPTGAALLTTLAHFFGTMPPLAASAIGYGAGDDRPGPVANVLRLVLGETTSLAARRDRVLLLETSLDDMSPEWLGHLMERLFASGALDVNFTPILMKKGRPGHEVKVLAPLLAEAAVTRTLFNESTTFGIRRAEIDRIILEREFQPVETPWGPVRIKVGCLQGEIVTASPEFEDLRAAAARAALPLKEVHRRVMDLWEKAGGRCSGFSSTAPSGTS